MQQHRVGLALALATYLTFAHVSTQAPDISGTWDFVVDMNAGGRGEPVFLFEQKGETLAGTVSNPRGTQKVTGSVKNDRATFGFEGVREGETFKALYRATIESATRMRGTVEFTGPVEGEGTWVATKR